MGWRGVSRIVCGTVVDVVGWGVAGGFAEQLPRVSDVGWCKIDGPLAAEICNLASQAGGIGGRGGDVGPNGAGGSIGAVAKGA